jgi:two-component system LytT family response regulator
MNTIRTYLLDDEPDNLEVLEHYIERLSLVEVVGKETNALKSLDHIKELRPDLIILDIQMPGLNGFELIEKLNNLVPFIIFVTAYDHFAVKAFRFSAIDYLLKPVSFTDLSDAINKVNHLRIQGSKGTEMESLFHNIRMLHTQKPKLAVSSFDGVDYYPIDEIVNCKANDNYTHIYFVDGRKVTASRTLKEFENMLTDFHFVRIHQSYLINLNHIIKYKKADGGSVLLSNGEDLPVSRSRKDDFLKKLGLE